MCASKHFKIIFILSYHFILNIIFINSIIDMQLVYNFECNFQIVLLNIVH
jgi:hypothetical protein